MLCQPPNLISPLAPRVFRVPYLDSVIHRALSTSSPHPFLMLRYCFVSEGTNVLNAVSQDTRKRARFSCISFAAISFRRRAPLAVVEVGKLRGECHRRNEFDFVCTWVCIHSMTCWFPTLEIAEKTKMLGVCVCVCRRFKQIGRLPTGNCCINKCNEHTHNLYIFCARTKLRLRWFACCVWWRRKMKSWMGDTWGDIHKELGYFAAIAYRWTCGARKGVFGHTGEKMDA